MDPLFDVESLSFFLRLLLVLLIKLRPKGIRGILEGAAVGDSSELLPFVISALSTEISIELESHSSNINVTETQ